MPRFTRQLCCVASIALFSFATAGLETPCLAQTTPSEDDSYIAIITAPETPLRAGGSKNYYMLGTAKAGDLVQVVGSKYQWARVLTQGPVFQTRSGVIKQPRNESPALRLSADGRTAITLGVVNVFAVNDSESVFALDKCWKKQGVFSPEQPVVILETIEEEKTIGYRVVLPPDAVAWISELDLRWANPAEQARWERELKELSAQQPPTSKTPSPGEILAREETIITPSLSSPDQTIPSLREESASLVKNVLNPTIPNLTTSPAQDPIPQSTPQVTTKLKKLERQFASLRDAQSETVDMEPLRHMYQDLATEYPDDARIQRYTGLRVDQLGLWMELQSRQGRLAKLRQQARLTSEDARAVATAFERTQGYAAVGRLSTSTIYTGRGLPRLFRLIQPSTGRTLAYLKQTSPTTGPDLTGALGRMVGIVGEKRYNGQLGLYLIEPIRLDYLAPRLSRPSALQQPTQTPSAPSTSTTPTTLKPSPSPEISSD